MLRKIHLNYGIIASPRFCYRSHFQKAESSEHQEIDDFRVLDLKRTQKNDQFKRKRMRQMEVPPPRFQQMRVDQDWGAVWPGPRSYQPATVPLAALRQGWVKPNRAPPGKFANAELLKIPNFLHLTPPVIKKQCETLKKFCTAFPEGLETEERQEKHFPIRVTTADYVTGLPTIRNPLSRIVTISLKLERLALDKHARDKFIRLVADRYNAENDEITITADRCPIRKQNLDYAAFLLTALFHESNTVEEWESSKVEADMELYDWNKNKSRESCLEILSWGKNAGSEPPCLKEYSQSVEELFNDGENDYNLQKYKEAVLKVLGLA